MTETTKRDERKYDPATQPGSPEFDGAEAYEAHLAALYPKDTEPTEDFVFPPMPNAVVNHEKVGPLFDRLSMHFYASKCMRLAEKAHAALTTAPEQAGEQWVGYYWIGDDNRQKFCGSYDTICAETAKRAQKVYTAPPPASTNRLTDEQYGAIQYAIAMVKSGPGWNIWHVNTLDALLRASRRSGDGRRVVKDENPACGLSWNGFNISGDEKSIREVRHLVNVAGYVSSLQEELKQARAIIAATEGK